MIVTFSIDYFALPEERLVVELLFEGHDEPTIVEMHLHGHERWKATAVIPEQIDGFNYRYAVRNLYGTTKRREQGSLHHAARGGELHTLHRLDRWHDFPADRPLRSSAFTECFTRRPDARKPKAPTQSSLTITVEAPMLQSDCDMVVCGNCAALGSWNPVMAPVMADGDFPKLTLTLPVDQLPRPLEYKFVIVRKSDKSVVAWEEGPNRFFNEQWPAEACNIAIDASEPRFNLERWRGAGVAIPVFSIRTEEDFGVGDFYGLRKMADWCALTGQSVIQVLPVNDTTMTDTWLDSYPYNANSTFALHPMYLHLPAIGELHEEARRIHYQSIAEHLNKLPDVDYEAVTRAKDLYARELFAQEGVRVLSSEDFKAFVNDNKDWLMPYAAFRVLRDRYKTAWMPAWGEYSVYDSVKIARFCEKHSKEISYHCFVQYFLARQLRDALDYARSKGVTIKGDIPIGISRTSVDAWRSPRLFNLDCQAGAPPDFFAVLGQNWGFPTYNWDEMKRDGYSWWKARFSTMAQFFDLYRIDHVLGFFRIWEIPGSALHGLLGYFNPALPLSPQEMRERFSFEFLPGVHDTPFITREVVEREFTGVEEKAESYLQPIYGTGRYKLRTEVDTQRKVADLFGSQPDSDDRNLLCTGLMNLLDEVLFIADPYHPGTYHPRINGDQTAAFAALSPEQQQSFRAMYHDFYYVRHNDFWQEKAMEKLPQLTEATRMMACAEDLGMIPACVPYVLDKLKLLSLEIQRMPKELYEQFADTSRYPYYSVCTTSTHDMSGIRQWWREDSRVTQAYYSNVLHHSGSAPADASPEICTEIIQQTLQSPSMLAILPLQDWLSTSETLRRPNPAEEVINIPAQSGHYWRYRMHLTVETLLQSHGFNSHIVNLLTDSNRNNAHH